MAEPADQKNKNKAISGRYETARSPERVEASS